MTLSQLILYTATSGNLAVVKVAGIWGDKIALDAEWTSEPSDQDKCEADAAITQILARFGLIASGCRIESLTEENPAIRQKVIETYLGPGEPS